MKDSDLKNIISLMLRNKDLLTELLDRFDPEDIERGFLLIPQNMINCDLKMLIMDKTAPFLNDYRIIFDQGSIYLDLDINGEQLGRLKAKYMLTIDDFAFGGNIHRIGLSYREDVKSEGNFMQNMAIKAAGLKGSYLQTAVGIAKLDFIHAEKGYAIINLDQIAALKKIPSSLKLAYTNCENGKLKLRFTLEE